MEHLNSVRKTIEMLSEKEMKKGGECNEMMALKFHYLGCIVQEVQKMLDRQSKTPEKKASDIVELMAKKLLKTNKEG